VADGLRRAERGVEAGGNLAASSAHDRERKRLRWLRRPIGCDLEFVAAWPGFVPLCLKIILRKVVSTVRVTREELGVIARVSAQELDRVVVGGCSQAGDELTVVLRDVLPLDPAALLGRAHDGAYRCHGRLIQPFTRALTVIVGRCGERLGRIVVVASVLADRAHR